MNRWFTYYPNCRLISCSHCSAKTILSKSIGICADCICYFGGDPSPQAIFSMRVAERALSCKRARPLRVCWETNGSEHPRIMKKTAAIALKSGGTMKVDLKAMDVRLHQALTGSSNAWTLENIRHLAAARKKGLSRVRLANVHLSG